MNLKKILSLAVAASVLFVGNYSVDASSKKNPFSDVKIVQMSDSEKASYIDKKTTDYLTPKDPSSKKKSYEVPRGWKQERISYNGVAVEKFTAKKNSNGRVVLFFHGGGYVIGLNDNYRDLGVHFGNLAGHATVFVPDYRTAPSNQYPSALDDAVNAYRGILADGYNPENIVVIGDSAGGNLSAAFMLYLKDHQLPIPKALILISPWLNLENSSPSRSQNYTDDKILGEKNKFLYPQIVEPSYAKDKNLKDPYISPVYGDLKNLPSTLIIGGSEELFLDDVLLFAGRAQIAGVDVQQSIYKNMSHDWILVLPELPESQAAFAEISEFINKNL